MPESDLLSVAATGVLCPINAPSPITASGITADPSATVAHKAKLTRAIFGKDYSFSQTGISEKTIPISLINSWEGLCWDSNAPSHSGSEVENRRGLCANLLFTFSDDLRRSVTYSILNSLSDILNIESWDNEDILPSAESFLLLIGFLASNTELRPPALTVSNEGNFVATWLRTRANMVRVEFHPEGRVTWLVLLAPVGHASFGENTTGSGSIYKLEKTLKAFDVWKIMASARPV